MAQRYTAQQGWSIKQKVTLLALVVLPLSAFFVNARTAFNLVMFGLMALFAAIVVVKSVAIVAGYLGHHTIEIGARSIADLRDEDLPVYSVLLPLYKEPEMVVELMTSLAELDYPKDKLDILFLLEADDLITQAAFRQHGAFLETLGAQVVVVPAGSPKTKPRACNHGLGQARGEFLVIFDAEDRPDTDQLKKAVVAFRELDPSTACLQAKLNYHNFGHNLLTRLFTLEYTAWFDLYLPGLHAIGAPIPLGGTSNHFRTDVLRQLDGWDAYNVTEDCDLGIRLSRAGFDTRILDSTTWEEACSEVRPWLTQRSRWVKGYLQTFLVHTRGLRQTIRELDVKGTALMALTVGGLVFSLVLTLPTVGLFGVWLYTYAHDPQWQPGRLIWGASISLFMFTGYFVLVHAVAIFQRRRLSLLPYTLLLPFYWAFMSLGAIRGVLQFFVKPFHWEKTPHGLSSPAAVRQMASGPGLPVIAPVPVGSPPGVPLTLAHPSYVRAPSSTLKRLHSPLRIGSRGLKAGWAGIIALGIVVLPYATFRETRAGQPREDEMTVDQSWFNKTSVKVEIKMGKHQRQISSQIVVFVKVLDGEWYEHLVPSYTRVDDQISFSVDLDEGWKPVGSSRPWGPWCLRRVRTFGIRVFGVVNRGLHYLDLAKVEPQGDRMAEAEAVEYRSAQPFPGQLEAYQTYEARFTLNRDWENPFDAETVALSGVFETPSGTTTRVPAFYSQDYDRSFDGKKEILKAIGPPHWAVRFAAAVPGHYRWRVEGKDVQGDLGSSAVQEFDVRPSSLQGYVRIDPNSQRFVREPGGPFYPIGINLRSPGDRGGQWNYDFQVPAENEGAFRMEAYLKQMKEAGISMARVWLTPWFGALEWRRDDVGYSGAGVYNLQNAWRIDRLMNTAEELGLYLELLIYPHGPYQPEFLEPWGLLPDSQWRMNPYNGANGGPVPQPTMCKTTNRSDWTNYVSANYSELVESVDFFRNDGARQGSRNLLRYLAARYGAYRALFGWVLWNEVDTVSTDIPAIADWHGEMSQVLRANDIGHHIISTEFRRTGYDQVWSLPAIDYVQAEAYYRDRGNFNGLVARFEDRIGKLKAFGKLPVIEEYGGGWWGGSMNTVAQNIHDGLWAGWTMALPSTPLAWWWNLIFEKRLDLYYRRFADYTKGEDLGGRNWSQQKPHILHDTRLRALSNQSRDAAYVWIYDPSVTEQIETRQNGLRPSNVAAAPLRPDLVGGHAPLLFPEVAGAELELTDLSDGEYTVEFWDTWVPSPSHDARLTVRGGMGRVPLPPMTRDLALKIKSAGAVADGAPTGR